MRNSEHRRYSHSFLAMVLERISLGVILPAVVPSFIIAYLSHLILDVVNKKSIRFLFPVEREFFLVGFMLEKLQIQFL